MTERPVALITGGSAGIGREFAEQLGGRGYDLILVARNADRLAEACAELQAQYGVAAEAIAADLADDDAVSRVVERIGREERLALVINNAGFGTKGSLLRADPARQEAMVRLHVVAPMRLTQAAIRAMAPRRHGAVINVASVAAFLASPGNVNYCATKAYLVVFSQGAAAELDGSGLYVQALCPGFFTSEFHQRMELSREQIGAIPRWLWLDKRAVVAESLRALDRRGPVVCIPSRRYKLIAPLLRLTPNALLARLSRLSGRARMD